MSVDLSAATSRRLAILDATGHAVIATDATGSIGYWNGAAERLYGWGREEVIGRNVVDVTPTDQSREESVGIMKLLAAGELWSGIFGVRDRSARSFQVAVTDLPLRKDGATVGIIGVSAENTAPADIVTTLNRFAVRQAEHERISIAADLERLTARTSEPHLIQLFTILLLKLHEAREETAAVWIEARRATQRLKLDFGLDSGEWLYMFFAPEVLQGGPAAIRNTLRSRTETRYGASLVDLAGGRLFAATLPTGGAAFHLFLPVAERAAP